MEGESRRKGSSVLQGSFTTGAIALVFLIIGYEAAVFIHHAAALKLAADRDRPDTVYVIDRALAADILADASITELPSEDGTPVTVRKSPSRPENLVKTRDKLVPRPVESFRFNPNTVSQEDLQRLGFSEKQAQSIVNYRLKGGRFRRPSDFAKSYVVADSVYQRLAPFIDIPKLDINKADSAALTALPGIGPWFAGKIVSYRNALHGYSRKEQLMEIYNFDAEKFAGLEDLISCSAPEPYPIWTLPEEELAKHPYISRQEAHGIVLYRSHNPADALSLEGLKKAGVISEDHAGKLSGIVIP